MPTAPRAHAPPSWRRSLAVLRWYRTPIAAALAMLALVLAIRAAAPAAPPTEYVVIAAHDLDAGAVVEPGDLRVARLPAAVVPASALRVLPSATRVVALPIRAGEVLTDTRFVDASLLGALGAGLVAAPIHLAEPPPEAFVHVGDLVDVLAAGESGTTQTVARSARVLMAPRAPSRSALRSTDEGDVLVVAVTSDAASALARSAAVAHLSVVIRSGGAS